MYFNSFPRVFYSSTGKTSDEKLCTHILKRVGIKNSLEDDMLLMDEHIVGENETPEVIAHKHFGSSKFHWIILLTNNITDRYFDWPLTTPQFNQFIIDKYGSAVDSPHHYEIVQTSGPTTSIDDSHLIQVNSTTAGATLVTNREYEQREQDKKRKIRLLAPVYLTSFLNEFKTAMDSTNIA